MVKKVEKIETLICFRRECILFLLHIINTSNGPKIKCTNKVLRYRIIVPLHSYSSLLHLTEILLILLIYIYYAWPITFFE